MTRRLLRVAGALLVLFASVTGSASAAATAVGTDDGTDAIGPPGGLPGPVPDFVSGLLDTVTEFVGDVLDGTPAEGPKGPAATGSDG